MTGSFTCVVIFVEKSYSPEILAAMKSGGHRAARGAGGGGIHSYLKQSVENPVSLKSVHPQTCQLNVIIGTSKECVLLRKN